MILLHDESDDVDEQAAMVRMEMVMKSVMMIIFVIAGSYMLIRAASENGWGRCGVGESISCAVYF